MMIIYLRHSYIMQLKHSGMQRLDFGRRCSHVPLSSGDIHKIIVSTSARSLLDTSLDRSGNVEFHKTYYLLLATMEVATRTYARRSVSPTPKIAQKGKTP